jgi:hypothetical protein
VAGAALILDLGPIWPRLPLTVLAMTVGPAGWFFFFSIFALRIRRNDMFQTVINVLYFVLLFASNMFYPLAPLPSWLRAAAAANPITWQVAMPPWTWPREIFGCNRCPTSRSRWLRSRAPYMCCGIRSRDGSTRFST